MQIVKNVSRGRLCSHELAVEGEEGSKPLVSEVVPRELEAVSSALCARRSVERLQTARLADGDDPAAVEADVTQSHQRITSAAVVVVVCLTMEDMDVYPDDRRSKSEFLMAVQSVAMAGQNLLLAAHAEGLGACWLCPPCQCAAPALVGATDPLWRRDHSAAAGAE